MCRNTRGWYQIKDIAIGINLFLGLVVLFVAGYVQCSEKLNLMQDQSSAIYDKMAREP